ncbi:type I polyketide synthase [Streptomyces yaizuensis]|uniref:Acyltransferase domain-containing protein n=1 Tax=Streptomyces yaizuensis TaxID=2989713 RepID=A0ABQ5P960_9ACTN|nr:polyketide synthase [Streptomyces sp. YSPA8]GLF98781.1 acyltransferase domain-containing protein [Streptomyces sp. YSPA8]
MTEKATSDEAIAIIGMSCRFAPDLDSPRKFWEFLADGRSTVGDMPDKRWKPYAAGSPQATAIMRETVRRGAFLDDIEGFDADFFGISPREADFLDPQQRFMLELTWEALADAGIPPLSLRGTDTAVYAAANSNDYGRRLLEDIPRTGAYAVNGTTFYGIANRVSYFLDLRGPSMAVDTACAGSLTALHLARQSLIAGEIPLAVVGGLNIMATPALNVALHGAGAMSPDGRSKAFDKDADGYGRGEGAGVVVLKRLADALRDGDPVQAVLRGSGVFQDGRSDGMMAPNGRAQEHMLRKAYERAGIAPGDVDYVEAHGTGTPTGDGEEISALAGVFGAGREPGRPCLIGSVKPNIGHVEGGSGIAGVIKTVLALRHRQLPPSLHGEPTPGVDWDTCGLALVRELRPWPAEGRPRRAGVSSYGVGGTISHVILEESPEERPGESPEGAARTNASDHDASDHDASDHDASDHDASDHGVSHHDASSGARPAVLPLSAASDAGLRSLAGAVADWLTDHPGTPLDSVGHTLALRRSHLARRAAVVAGSTAELTGRLRALAADGTDATLPGVATGRAAPGQETPVVWVFSGHGAQWSGMGRDLLDHDPAFTAAVDSLADVFREELGWTPREALTSGGPWTAAHIQALTFALQTGLAEAWRARGVEPGAVVGHSVGEIAAAVAAGVLGRQEAARFACRRAAALQRLEGRGAMAMVGLPFDEARRQLADHPGAEAAISAAPASTVVSGDRDAIERAVAAWRDAGVWVRPVDSAIAFHSAQVDEVAAEVAAAARLLRPRPATVPLYSTALADPRSTAARDSAYWVTNLRSPVRFTEAVAAAAEDGHRLFAEISSHPVVAHSVSETLLALGIEDTAVTGTLRRDTPGPAGLLGNLATLHCHGAAVDWSRDHGAGAPLPLPPAVWQHRPYWIFPESAADSGLGSGHDPARHSLLGGRMTVSGSPSRQVWQTRLDMTTRPYPQSHGLVGVEVTPAASIINTFAEAAGGTGGNGTGALRDIVLRTPLAVEPPRVVQVVREGRSLSLATRLADDSAGATSSGSGGYDGAESDDGDEWITHTTASLAPGAPAPTGRIDRAALRSRLPEGSLTRADEMFARMGVEGYAFPWTLDELRYDEREQLAVLDIVPPPARTAASWAHVIDGALTISAMVVSPGDATVLWMSRSIESVGWRGEPPARIVVHAIRSPRSPHDTVDVQVADESGEVVCEVTGLRFAAVEHLGTAVLPRDLVHEIVWRPVPLDGPGAAPATAVEQLVLIGDPAVTGPLAQQCAAAGVPCVLAGTGPDAVLGPELFTRPGAIVVAPAPGAGDEGDGGDEGDEPVERSAERVTWTLIRTVQRVAEIHANTAGGLAPQRVWCLTSGVRDAHDERSVAHGPLWGVSRIIAGDHPGLWGGAVDLPAAGLPAVDGTTGTRLLAVLRGLAGQEDVVALTGDGPLAARLARIERSADGTPLQCSPSGTVLITGGLGALGLEVARWLVDRGARRLLLAGRRGLPPRAAWETVTDPDVRRQIDGVLALEALGVTVGVLVLDITDADQVAAALAPGALGLPPVRGIVHAAGVVNNALVDKVEPDGLREVLAPKATGAMVLHRLFPPGTLDFFVLFSSCGQFARLSGQAGYAAANSFLDALAAHRNAGGHTETVSIGWTAWRGLGLSADIATTMFEANSRGLEAVSVSEAFRAWAFGDRFQAAYQAVLRVVPTPPHTPRLPMFRELTVSDEGDGTAGGQSFAAEIEGLSAEEARERVTDDVRAQVAAELNLGADEIDMKRPLVELGVDSVMTVALRVRLHRRYGLDLPPTILWARPTVAALSEHVVDGLRPAGGAEPGEETEPRAEKETVAVPA